MKNKVFKSLIALLLLVVSGITLATNFRKARAEDFWDTDIYNRGLYIYGLNQYSEDGNRIVVEAWDYIGNIVEYNWSDLDNTLEIVNNTNETYYTFENGNILGVYIVLIRDNNVNYFETGTITLSSNINDAIVNPIWNISNSTFGFEWVGTAQTFYKLSYEIPNNVNYQNLTLLQKNAFMYDVIQTTNPLNILENSRNKGYNIGYGEGYNIGKEEGIIIGRAEAENEQVLDYGIFDWVKMMGLGVGALLDIQVFPNIKLGYIVLIPLVFTLIMVIIKIVRKG